MAKQQWIMVMSKAKAPAQDQFGMTISYSIDELGAEKAMEKAQTYIAEQSKVFRQVEFKLQGGVW